MIFRLKNVPEGYEKAAGELLKERGYALCVPGEEKNAGEGAVIDLSIELTEEKEGFRILRRRERRAFRLR